MGALAQGHMDVQGTDTVNFMQFDKIPKGRKVICLRLLAVEDRPMKVNPKQTDALREATMLIALLMCSLKP